MLKAKTTPLAARDTVALLRPTPAAQMRQGAGRARALPDGFEDAFRRFDDASMLITGGTGSFGRRFIDTLLQRSRARRLIVFSRDEYKQYEMQHADRPRRRRSACASSSATCATPSGSNSRPARST